MTPRTLRLKLDYNLDPSDSEVTIEAVKSNALNIEFGIFQDSIPYDLSGLTSVTMVIRPARGTATNLAAITLPVASLTALPNSVRWNRGTMQHGIFEWTTAQMNQTVTGDYDDYWWSCYALLTTNEEVTLGNGIFRIYESNIANGGVPPVNPGATITADEADARYVRFDAATSLTGGQQTQARENIDADNAANLTSGIIPDARMPNLTGDITTSEGAVATTLATVNSNVGSFGSATQASAITVNAKGLVTAASAITVTPAESSLTFTDITTNNATSLKHGFLPKLSGSASDVLKGDGTWAAASAGSGSVTSVAMSVPSILTVSGSPITTSGTLAVTLATQAANLVFAGPATGVDATPTFRSLVAADIPSLSSTYLTVANPTATGELNLSDSGTFNSWQFAPGSRYFKFIEAGGAGFYTQFDVVTLTADRNIFIPNASGTLAVSASGNIALSAAGNISFTGTLPVANGGTGITALGTGVATALGVNVGSAGAFVTFNGALGTPSSGTLTSCTGLPISTGVSGLGSNVATFLATPTIANLNSAVSDADVAILGANTFTGAQTINQGTITSSTPSGLSQTWNGAGVQFKALTVAVSQTAYSSGIGTESYLQEWLGGASGTTQKAFVDYNGGFYGSGFAVSGSPSSGGGWAGVGIPGDGVGLYANGSAIGMFGWFDGTTNYRLVMRSDAKIGFAPGTSLGYVAPDAFITRKDAAVIQLGADAEGVTNQSLTAASRITSDGVGANLTISAGNGRGGAGGSLIFSTYTTAAAATIGTLTTRLTLDTAGLLTFADAVDMAFNATTGTKIGTATGQKIGFWNATPVVQQVLATGGGATVDNVITFLQTVGLCKQS